ncbi:rod shape-determining protein RodA [uncultured Cardiobacterium sp.]|uniref:rod shape-determining protein RodA n=1 Tax=uncultured Cardiobacterium sp. TaxID=417619 RepID=UPI0034363100
MHDVRKKTVWQLVGEWLRRIDIPMLFGLLVLMGGSLLILRSAGSSDEGILMRQTLRFAAAIGILLAIVAVPPRYIRRLTAPAYWLTLVLLLLVLIIGSRSNGAQRWLNIGIARIQPSELAKLTIPLMVAWLVTIRAAIPGIGSVILAILVIVVPVVLIFMEPDLGTALLVSASGFITLFLAGLPVWIIVLGGVLAAIGLPLFWMFGIKEYQRDRVLTLFNPEADPFGNGYHIIQSKIAIGSGGLSGKGYMQGTQSQLEFLPESSTDFIFAVIAEETGLIGVGLLLLCYGLIIARGLYLALHLTDRFARIMVASILLTLFINVFVNIGMVSGILPVVGLPLAMISYGGSSILSLMAGFALAMNLAGGFRAKKDEEHL